MFLERSRVTVVVKSEIQRKLAKIEVQILRKIFMLILSAEEEIYIYVCLLVITVHFQHFLGEHELYFVRLVSCLTL